MTIHGPNNHSEAAIRGIERLKEEITSLDGWKVVKKSGNLTLYNKPLGNSSLPALLRGDATLTPPPGATARQVLRSAIFPGARMQWDYKFESYKIHACYTDLSIFAWSKIKAPWPVSPRDICFVTHVEESDTDCYCSIVSVVDDAIPEVSGCVRANLMVSGWRVYQKSATEMVICFVNQVDLAGSLPTSFVNKMSMEVPETAGEVAKYVDKFGFPPCSIFEGSVEMTFEDFNHSKLTYVLEVVGEGGSITSTVSGRMYPKGFSARLEGNGKIIQEQDKNGNTCIQLDSIQGSVKLIIEKK
ncbi:Bet v1-like protein [Backusella circina FSU 941]|nr:Bet v1-like protein [Backusella circina FSU 941]